MCSPRGVVKEFEDLKAAIERLAGSAGTAEFHRILRQHGAHRVQDFTRSQMARLCASDVYGLLRELRAAARENQEPLALEDTNVPQHDSAASGGR